MVYLKSTSFGDQQSFFKAQHTQLDPLESVVNYSKLTHTLHNNTANSAQLAFTVNMNNRPFSFSDVGQKSDSESRMYYEHLY